MAVTTLDLIDKKLHGWALAVGGVPVMFEAEDLPGAKGPRVDLHPVVAKAAPNPIVTVVAGVEHIVSEIALDVTVNVRGAGAMERAQKLIASLKSGSRFRQDAAGLWQVMGLGGVISEPTDLSALETGATLSRVEFRVRFHAAIEFTSAGDYIQTTQATVREGEKGTIAVVTLGPNPHPIPAGCN